MRKGVCGDPIGCMREKGLGYVVYGCRWGSPRPEQWKKNWLRLQRKGRWRAGEGVGVLDA